MMRVALYHEHIASGVLTLVDSTDLIEDAAQREWGAAVMQEHPPPDGYRWAIRYNFADDE